MKKLVVAGISLLAVGLLVLGSQTNVVGYQIQQGPTQTTNGPDIKFIRHFEIHYGTLNDWRSTRALACYFTNQGDEDIEFWNIRGEGKLLLPFFHIGSEGHCILAPSGYIHPGGTGEFGGLYLPPYVPWPQVAYNVHIYIGTGSGGWYPITEFNWINGSFIFWGSQVIPLKVSYSD